MLKIQNYLDGALSDAIDNQIIDNFNPSKGVVYGSIPNSNEKDVEKAVKSAEEAFPEWGVLNNEKRFKIMNRIAELIDANRDELAKAESMDQGKPLWLAKNEMIRAAQNMRFFCHCSDAVCFRQSYYAGTCY